MKVAHLTVTVNHNDDELVLSMNDKPLKTVSIRGGSTMRVMEFLESLLDELDTAHADCTDVFVSLEQIDEDRRKTINEW